MWVRGEGWFMGNVGNGKTESDLWKITLLKGGTLKQVVDWRACRVFPFFLKKNNAKTTKKEKKLSPG